MMVNSMIQSNISVERLKEGYTRYSVNLTEILKSMYVCTCASCCHPDVAVVHHLGT